MTLPNMPFDDTDPNDLPQGTAYPGSAWGTLLQNPSVSKFANLGGGRFPGVFFSQPAGSPLNPSMPLGFITDLFAKFSSYVAQADPATIKKPEDLHDLITDFVTGLPLSALGDATNPLEQIQADISDVLANLGDIWDYYEGLTGGVRAIQNGINQGWIDGDESEADADIFATMRGIRTAISGIPWTRVVCTSTQTWNPPDPAEYDLKEVVLILVAAGTAGADGSASGAESTDTGTAGGVPGLGGGFVVRGADVEAFDALHVTIGTNGSPAVVRADDGSGAILAQANNNAPSSTPGQWGWTPSASGAGNGGHGGRGGDTLAALAGSAGSASPAIAGGPGGAPGANSSGTRDGSSGTPGGSVLATNPVPCGGSGGGGGGGAWRGNFPVNGGGLGGHGAAGGFPGGGGGGGGGRSLGGSSNGSVGLGGPGGAGLVLIFYRGEAIEP